MKQIILALLLPLFLISCSKGGGGETPSIITSAHATTGTFLKDIIFTTRINSDTDGVVSASCLSEEVVVGGGAYCSGSVTNDQGGFLFASYPVGNGFLAACYDLEINISTPISAYAICASAVPGTAVTGKPLESEFALLAEEENKLLEMVNSHRQKMQP